MSVLWHTLVSHLKMTGNCATVFSTISRVSDSHKRKYQKLEMTLAILGEVASSILSSNHLHDISDTQHKIRRSLNLLTTWYNLSPHTRSTSLERCGSWYWVLRQLAARPWRDFVLLYLGIPRSYTMSLYKTRYDEKKLLCFHPLQDRKELLRKQLIHAKL